MVAPFRPGHRLTSADLNEIVRRVKSAIFGGPGINATRTGQQIAVSKTGHQIIPTKDSGLKIFSAVDKPALDLIVVKAPNLGWDQTLETLYERSQDGLTWLIVNRWRAF